MSSLRTYARARQGFSLVEVSVVIAVLSVVAVMGLEATSIYFSRTSYSLTQERQATIKQALMRYRFIYGRLPCPAQKNLSTSSIYYGKEQRVSGTLACDVAGTTMSGVHFGDVPVRDLNLPLSYMKDGYGSEMIYLVDANMTRSGATAGYFLHSASTGVIEMRTGKIEQPCSTMCQVIGAAAYALLSPGPDKRGSNGTPCINSGMANLTSIDGMIDTVNCRFGSTTQVRVNGNGSAVTIPANVLYDSRFNNGTIEEMHFDDLIVWQTKGQL